MMRSTLLASAVALVSALGLTSCDINEYCITCATDDGGATGADATGTGVDSGPVADAAPGGDAGCVPAGQEQCNDRDDDCDGNVDEAPVLMVGDTCGSNTGACMEGTLECTAGSLVCGGAAINPMAESCNDADDDCDGMTDEGDPGGGVSCGISTGECQRGITQCISGNVECTGNIEPVNELCDQKDNDCDGDLDEGNPEGGAACGSGMGACMPGVDTCIGGNVVCVGGSGPGFEACDGVNNDCDADTDEGYDFMNNPKHCGGCNIDCATMVTNGGPGCNAGNCEVAFCFTGYYDLDTDPTDCEYMCNFQGDEVCNGLDDDCDGNTDEGLTPPTNCNQVNECAGTVSICTGAGGWMCDYANASGDVSHDGMGNIVPESDCDEKDNDCDGVADDAFSNKGDPCTRGSGVCQTSGTIVCNAMDTGVECSAAAPSMGSSEVCNGLDDDCDNTVDEGAPDDWIQVGAFWIHKYEASRQNATNSSPGTREDRACSLPDRIPWTNITHPEAEAICAVVGARLCTEAEWEQACQAGSSCTWSYQSSCNSYNANRCNGNDYDPSGAAGDQDIVQPTETMTQCFANWGGSNRIYDMSGNVKEWTAERSANVNPLRGGSYNNTATGISCGFDFVLADDTFQFENVGFRCCRSTPP